MTAFLRLCALGRPQTLGIALALLLSIATLLSAVALMATSGYLIAKAAIVTDIAAMAIAFTSVRVFAISRSVFRYLERLTSHIVTFRILTHVRAWFYASVEPLAPARFGRYRSGDLLSRSVSDIQTVEGFFIRVLIPPFAAFATSITVCVFLSMFDLRFGLALMLFLILAGLIVPLLTLRAMSSRAGELVRANGRLHSMLVDEVQGAADLLVFDRSLEHRRQGLDVARETIESETSLASTRGVAAAGISLLVTVATMTVLALAIPLVTSGDLGGVYLTMLALVTIAAFEAVLPAAQAMEHWGSSRPAIERITEITDASPPVVDPPYAVDPGAGHGIELRDVTFAYDPAGEPVLDRLNLDVPDGGRLGIAGPSGVGKSTIVNLLLRFWELQGGEIKIGGCDIRDNPAETTRDLIGVAPQDIHLFNTTIRDNLMLANPAATDEEILEACRTALLEEFIEGLPDGLDTPLGENGLSLSGGERQRLAIARVILKDAQIVILDEPTANLDPATESCLLNSLEPFFTGRTVLLISHRRAVLDRAHRVVELRHGRAVEMPPRQTRVAADASAVER